MSVPEGDPLLTVREARERVRVGRTWLYDALNAGVVPGVRFGRRWMIRSSVVAELVRHGAPARPSPRETS